MTEPISLPADQLLARMIEEQVLSLAAKVQQMRTDLPREQLVPVVESYASELNGMLTLLTQRANLSIVFQQIQRLASQAH